jgi:hypothetical protein
MTGHLDHDPIAQRHVQAGWVQVIFDVWRDHRLLFAQAADFVIGEEHQV